MNIDPGHHAEPHKTGHRWLDIGMTLAILLVSISSLIVAIVHSRTLERMADANARLVETNSWPFLSYNTANGADISMSLVNDGVGPAKIEEIEVSWKGKAQRNALEFLKACCAYAQGTGRPQWELIAGRVLRAGQSIDILTLPHTSADEPAWKALNDARISRNLSVNVCYCSVFDECWQEDVVRFSLKPREVERCNAPALPYGIPR